MRKLRPKSIFHSSYNIQVPLTSISHSTGYCYTLLWFLTGMPLEQAYSKQHHLLKPSPQSLNESKTMLHYICVISKQLFSITPNREILFLLFCLASWGVAGGWARGHEGLFLYHVTYSKIVGRREGWFNFPQEQEEHGTSWWLHTPAAALRYCKPTFFPLLPFLQTAFHYCTEYQE